MIVEKVWIKKKYNRNALGSWERQDIYYRGWFLFGFIPLYIKQLKRQYF